MNPRIIDRLILSAYILPQRDRIAPSAEVRLETDAAHFSTLMDGEGPPISNSIQQAVH